MATPPSFISITDTSFTTTTTPKTTANIAVTNGDFLVAWLNAADGTGTATYTVGTATGSTSAWTQRVAPPFSDANHSIVQGWTATATATGNITVTFTRTAGNAINFGGEIQVWRNHGGVGNANSGNNGTSTGTPTVAVTCSANSGLSFSSVDWNAVAGTVTFTATSGSPVTDLSNQTGAGSTYCSYIDHVVDVSAAGSKSMGMSSPTGQRYVCGAIEILGTAGAAFIAPKPLITSQAIQRATNW